MLIIYRITVLNIYLSLLSVDIVKEVKLPPKIGVGTALGLLQLGGGGGGAKEKFCRVYFGVG
jgi:hypothetical protein